MTLHQVLRTVCRTFFNENKVLLLSQVFKIDVTKNRDIFRIESYCYIMNASKFPRNSLIRIIFPLQSDSSKLCLECFSNNMLVIFYIIDHLLSL